MNNPTPLSTRIRAHALLIGERVNLRQLPPYSLLANNPPMVEVSGGGTAALFRFGVVVFFNVPPVAQSSFLQQLRHLVTEPVEHLDYETDDLEIRIDAQRGDSLEQGILYLVDHDIGRQQVVADILAKSVLLAGHEGKIGSVFDRVEPLAEKLQRHGRGVRQARELVRYIGETLLIQHRLVGRAEVGEKPEILWERPELERLFVRLEQEYEIKERRIALEHKLNVIGATAETLLDLLQNQRSLRVEWYIVILIVVEIVLSLYELFFRHA